MSRVDIYILIFLTITTLYGYSTGVYTYAIRILCLIAARICYPYIGNLVVGLKQPAIEIIRYYGHDIIADFLLENVNLLDKILYIFSFFLIYALMRIFSKISKSLLYPKRKVSRKINQYLGMTLGFLFGLVIIYVVYCGVNMIAETGLPIGIEMLNWLKGSFITNGLCWIFEKIGV